MEWYIDEPSTSTQIPSDFQLEYPYPNPFNCTTRITVHLKQSSNLKVEVFNLLGRSILVLQDDFILPGTYNFVIDGSTLASGTYFVKADVPGKWSDVKRAIFIK